MKREILLLGNPRLYEASAPCTREEQAEIAAAVTDLKDTLTAFRAAHGFGRAVAAPQIGIQKRLIYMDTGEPVVFINPSLSFPDGEKMTVLDDCMSFPALLVRLERYKRCVIRFYDLEWEERTLFLEGDLSELLQHEYDHLDGILATMRAPDSRSFFFNPTV